MGAGDNKEMPFLDHLEELRWRLLKSLAALAVGFVLAFWVVTKFDLFTLLQQPIAPYLHGRNLIYTHPADPFRISLSVALALGGIVALPVIVYQAWAFLSPALYTHEKKVVIPVVIAGAVLFLCGVALSFFIILPLTLRFLTGLQATGLDAMISVREYFDFAIGMSLALGAVFETPIAILALTALGLVTPQLLNRFRRHAAVICLVTSAFITPGQDPFSMLALAAPLYLLFEVSVIVSAVVYRRKMKRAAAAVSPGEAGAAA
jgi:sec-independent protein translocase protein TatC